MITIVKLKIRFVVLLLVIFTAKGLRADVMLEIPYTTISPMLGGVFSLAEWRHGAVIRELQPPTNRIPDDRWTKAATEIRLLWDEDFLYVLFLCRDDAILTVPAQRDDSRLYLQDVCEIFLDATGNARSYWEFQLNADNVLFDQLIRLPGAPEFGADGRLTDEFFLNRVKCDPSLNMEGIRTDAGKLRQNGKTIGWFTRWAIPAKALFAQLSRKHFADGLRIRAQFCRYDYQSGEQIFSYWTHILNGCPHTMPGHMGVLRFKK